MISYFGGSCASACGDILNGGYSPMADRAPGDMTSFVKKTTAVSGNNDAMAMNHFNDERGRPSKITRSSENGLYGKPNLRKPSLLNLSFDL